jgi:hypothetical protein
VQTILWHQVAGPLLKTVLEFRDARGMRMSRSSVKHVSARRVVTALATGFLRFLSVLNCKSITKIFASACAKDWALVKMALICTWGRLVLAQMVPYFIHLQIRNPLTAWLSEKCCLTGCATNSRRRKGSLSYQDGTGAFREEL